MLNSGIFTYKYNCDVKNHIVEYFNMAKYFLKYCSVEKAKPCGQQKHCYFCVKKGEKDMRRKKNKKAYTRKL